MDWTEEVWEEEVPAACCGREKEGEEERLAVARKPTKVVPKGKWVVVDYKNPPKKLVVGYRRKKVKGHLITVAILKKKGPKGGRTVVTSVWHPRKKK